jgi:hypothetical protein
MQRLNSPYVISRPTFIHEGKDMHKRPAYRKALALGVISLTLLLGACVCRPVRVGQAEYTTPTTIADLRASLPD